MTKKNSQNIYLIGPMGAGKTSVGKSLSQLTHRIFIDSDHEIEKRTGVDIPWIFEVEGEEGFRKREAEVITQLTLLNNIVLSVGGGAITSLINRQHLSENGMVIYLQVSLEKQMKRIMTSKHSRPMLNKHNTAEKLQQLNETRQKLYESIADFTYDTDQFNPNDLAELIVKDIKKRVNL